MVACLCSRGEKEKRIMTEPFKMDLLLQHSSVAHSANRDWWIWRKGKGFKGKRGLRTECVSHDNQETWVAIFFSRLIFKNGQRCLCHLQSTDLSATGIRAREPETTRSSKAAFSFFLVTLIQPPFIMWTFYGSYIEWKVKISIWKEMVCL